MRIRCSDERCNRLAKAFINPQGRDCYYCDTCAQMKGYCSRCLKYSPPLSLDNLCEHCRWTTRVWQEMQRIGWTIQDGKNYCERKFNQSSRAEMTIEQLRQFWVHLRGIPTPKKRKVNR